MMKPIVHGLEKQYAGRIDVVYIDTSEPGTQDVQSRLNFRGTPQFVFLDASGQAVGTPQFGVVEESALRSALDSLLMPNTP